MKLTNPTDDELRHTFAMEVAKYTLSQYGEYFTSAGLFAGSRSTLPARDTSMDSVLPWLERWHDDDPQKRDIRIGRRLAGDWLVTLRTRANPWDSWNDSFEEDGELPRACVIALLRAHGVEVEFTK